MRIAALEEFLREKSKEDLETMRGALDVLCNKSPEQLIQELGLRTLRDIVKIVLLEKGDRKDGGS